MNFKLDLEGLLREGEGETKYKNSKLISFFPKYVLRLNTTFLGQQAGHFEYGRSIFIL